MRDNRPSAALYELLEEVGSSSRIDEMLSVLDRRLRGVLPFDALKIYLPGDSEGGGDAEYVAHTGRPAFNRDPRLNAGAECVFRSMLAVPLDDAAGAAGVLALFSCEAGVFEPADLGALLWIRSDLARAVRKALRHESRGETYSQPSSTVRSPVRCRKRVSSVSNAWPS
ncbi:MAG: hypothetical protein ABSC23_11315 [Bryobacteraceae bacterium]|jgi:hypothetical protein